VASDIGLLGSQYGQEAASRSFHKVNDRLSRPQARRLPPVGAQKGDTIRVAGRYL